MQEKLLCTGGKIVLDLKATFCHRLTTHVEDLNVRFPFETDVNCDFLNIKPAQNEKGSWKSGL